MLINEVLIFMYVLLSLLRLKKVHNKKHPIWSAL
nr:MAG TPA: hypothetical protein [Caudoviricetes sp.]